MLCDSRSEKSPVFAKQNHSDNSKRQSEHWIIRRSTAERRLQLQAAATNSNSCLMLRYIHQLLGASFLPREIYHLGWLELLERPRFAFEIDERHDNVSANDLVCIRVKHRSDDLIAVAPYCDYLSRHVLNEELLLATGRPRSDELGS